MYNLIIIGVIALIVLLSAGQSALFGFRRTSVRLIAAVLSAAGAIVTCVLIKSFLPTPATIIELIQNNLAWIGTQFGTDAVAFIEQAIEIANISPTLLELVVQLAGALILPLACVSLFCIFFAVSWIVCAIVMTVIERKEKRRAEEELAEDGDTQAPMSFKGSRWVAAGLGLVQGLVIALILFVPVSAYTSIAAPALDELTAQQILDENDPMIGTAKDVVGQIHTAPAMKAYRLMGGDLLSDTLMSMKVSGTKVNTADELGSLITLVQHVTELSKTEFKDYSQEQAEIIRAIGDSFGDSELMTPIIGDILYAATDAWLNGEAFLGMERPSLGESAEMLEPFVTALLEIFHEDAKNAVLLKADVKTLAEMVATLAQNGVFANLTDTNALMSSLGGEGVVSSLITTLGENQTMKRLIPEVMNLGVRAIGQILNVPADTEAVYDQFMDEVTGTLNEIRALPEQERITTLSSELTAAFDTAGVDIDPQVLDFYATAMIHDLVDNNPNGEVTAADVQAFFVLYAESTLSNSSSVAAKPQFDMLSSTDKDKAKSDPLAGSVYESMTEEQRKNSAAAAVAQLCVKLTKLDADAADISEQAKAIVNEIFTDLLGADHAALEHLAQVEITAPVSASAVDNAASMKSTEDMKKTSTVITLESMLIDTKEAALKINSETLANDAAAISAIFEAATSLTDALAGSEEKLDVAALASSVGTILDSLSQTETFGKDKTAGLFTAVLQSETVRDAANIDMKTATELANKATEGEPNYTQTMTTIAGSVNIMETLSKDGNISEDELVELIRNLNAQTAGMIEVYVTPARLVENNIPEKFSVFTSDMIKSLFGYIADSDKQNSEIEAKALNQIMNIALAAKKSDEKNLFSSAPGAEDGKLPTATETVNTLLDSKAVRHALVDVMTENGEVTVFDPYGFGEKINEGSPDYTACVDAIYAYRQAHPEVDDLVFEALAALMGIKIDL